jgi:hypothetical protein
MPHTRFVLKKALELGQTVVVILIADLLNCSGYIQGRYCFSALYYGVRTRPGWWLIIFSLVVTVNALSTIFISMMDGSS